MSNSPKDGAAPAPTNHTRANPEVAAGIEIRRPPPDISVTHDKDERIQRPPLVDIKQVAASAVPHLEAICAHWLPDGKREGHDWKARNPTRDDQTAGSFSVSLITGECIDFATGEKTHDIVSTIKYLDGLATQGEAARRVAEFLGTAPLPEPTEIRAKSAPRPMKDRPLKHPVLGVPSMQWEYRDATGELLTVVCRFETIVDGKPDKEFRPLTPTPAGWIWQAPPTPRPLYGLDRLAAFPMLEREVILCEGEKAADAAGALLPECVTIASMNGAQSPDKSDWSPLAGRQVRIWPDADQAGARFAKTAAALIHAAGAASVSILDLSSLTDNPPQGWDAADALAEGWTPERFAETAQWVDQSKRQTDQAPPEPPPEPATTPDYPWPEPGDIASPTDPAPYPLTAFPSVAQSAIREYADFGRQPLSLVAGSALAQMSLAAQPLADVARNEFLISPISLYLMTVAASGERKTAADKQFGRAIRAWVRRERDQRMDDYRRSVAMAADHKARMEGVKTRIKTLSHKDDEDSTKELERQRERLIELEQNPIVPVPLPSATHEDVNPASLAYAVATGWPSCGLFSDEAGAVIGSQGLGEEHATGLLSLMNILWDGRDFIPTRKQAAVAELRGRRFSTFLMLQPDLLPKLIAKGARNLGFLARFLLSAPVSTMGSRLYREPPADWKALNDFDLHLTKLLEHELPIDRGGEDHGARMMLSPPIMRLDPAAKQMWVEFHDAVESELCQFGEFCTVQDVASKTAENAVRIAAVFKLFDQGRVGRLVERDYLEGGIAVASWHLHEARRLFLEADTPPELQDARELSAWLAGKGRELANRDGEPLIDQEGMIAVRDIARVGPNRVRDTTRRDDALDLLIEAGHVRRIDVGKKRSIQVNPGLLT